MFDTMTLTKAAGALCGSLLVFMLGGWVAQEIYGSDAHGDGHDQAYVIEVEEEEPAAEEEEVDFASLYVAADASKGERVFNKCSACHQLEAGANGVGPHLYDAVGREVGAVDEFNYSGALSEVAQVWSPEELNAFLENPRTYAPGTSMGFAGLNKVEDRVNVIAYIDQQDGDMTAVEGAGGDEGAAAEDATAEETTEEAAADTGAAEMTDTAAAGEAAEAAGDADTAASTEADAEAEMTDMAAAETEGSEDMSAADASADTGAEAEATEVAAAGEEAGFAAMVAAADVSAGERVFNQCRACHVLEAGTNRVGPYLHGVVNRDIAAADGFRYSNALQSLDGQWTYDELSAFLENPREYAEGNRMSYRGLSDEEDRAAVIAYIEAESQ